MLCGEYYRAQSFLLCSFFHSPFTSSLLVPNILLKTLFIIIIITIIIENFF